MQEITINICYDKTQSSHFKLFVGDEWVRIIVVNPGQHYDTSEKFSQIISMLKTFVTVPRELRKITIEGPDACDVGESASAEWEAIIRNCWYESHDRLMPHRHITDLSQKYDVSQMRAVAPLTVSAPFTVNGAPPAFGEQATVFSTSEIDDMAQIVINKINLHGAAPDFRSRKPGNKDKVINFIKSASGVRNMGDNVAEKIMGKILSMNAA
jgi:hypothetical protein